jgi:hypothetical protein
VVKDKMEHSLRPIGTEFEIDLGVDPSSTDPRGRKIRYRVVDHKRVMRFFGDEEGELAEVLEAISIEYYDIDYSKYCWNFTY